MDTKPGNLEGGFWGDLQLNTGDEAPNIPLYLPQNPNKILRFHCPLLACFKPGILLRSQISREASQSPTLLGLGSATRALACRRRARAIGLWKGFIKPLRALKGPDEPYKVLTFLSVQVDLVCGGLLEHLGPILAVLVLWLVQTESP